MEMLRVHFHLRCGVADMYSNSGAGVGIIKEVLSAKDVVLKTQREAAEVIRRLGSTLAYA
jgi:hypothetical protein